MTTVPRYPSLFQINTRVWLQRLSREAGKPITLADLDDTTIDGFAEKGFDWIWMLSVWQIGAAGRAVSRGNRQWRAEFEAILPDLTDDDIAGSGFAITAYTVSDAVGGETALAQFRERLAKRGIKLLLDFVPNHTAPDDPWVKAHPDYYVEANAAALAVSPYNYLRVETDRGPNMLAYGRDPNLPVWPDTLQLNYANPELQRVRIDELIAIAGKCDGVRCDMAMLLLPEIFQRTWGITPEPFWPKATAAVRAQYPAFTFMAEAYWDLEWTLHHQGFDYRYDKRLYDRLREGHVTPIRDHLLTGLDYQDKLVRFLENHDEPRAASEFFWPQHQAAAMITFLSPGLRFFYDGQFDGARVRVPPHLGRGPVEPTNPEIAVFYARLLAALRETAFRDGAQPQPAWSNNLSSDSFVAYAWAGENGSCFAVVVNYAGNKGQCRLPLPFPEFCGKQVRLTDSMGTEVYDRDGADLVDNGLYIDHAPWHFNVFALQAI
jgi:glycosidase